MPDPNEWAVALAGSSWMLVALFAFVTIDGFLPPVPSESLVIALAALSASAGGPDVWLVGAVAAAGALTGDQIAYSIGRRISVRRLRLMRAERAQRAVTWAEGALARRGAAFIIGARFVPVGRVAVNITAGTVGYSRRRFSLVAAVAAVTWSSYSVALGVGAMHLLDEHHPLVGVTAGVVGGLVTGALVDRAIQRLLKLRGRRPATAVPDAVALPAAGTLALPGHRSATATPVAAVVMAPRAPLVPGRRPVPPPTADAPRRRR